MVTGNHLSSVCMYFSVMVYTLQVMDNRVAQIFVLQIQCHKLCECYYTIVSGQVQHILTRLSYIDSGQPWLSMPNNKQ